MVAAWLADRRLKPQQHLREASQTARGSNSLVGVSHLSFPVVAPGAVRRLRYPSDSCRPGHLPVL